MSKLLWLVYFIITLLIFLLAIYFTSDKFDFVAGVVASIIGSLIVGLFFPRLAAERDSEITKKTTILWVKDSIRKPLNDLHNWLSSCSTVLDGYPKNISDSQQYKRMNTKLKSSLRALSSLENMSVEGEKENEKK